jgi:hypothetical protein
VKGPNGFVAYEGPSTLDGAPIVVIVTGLNRPSKNGKTGAMLQSYILRSDVHPSEALKSGEDVSICGGCTMRPTLMPDYRAGAKSGYTRIVRRCYVRMESVGSVWRCYKAGNYPRLTNGSYAWFKGNGWIGTRNVDLMEGKILRLGTYGDPAAAPLDVWAPLVAAAKSHTGYTHQWRLPHVAPYASILMASADSAADRADANAAGWRTFRVLTATDAGNEALGAREISCPASKEAGKVATCETCRLCAGTSRPAKDIAIIDHSSSALGARRRSLKLQVIQAAAAAAA